MSTCIALFLIYLLVQPSLRATLFGRFLLVVIDACSIYRLEWFSSICNENIPRHEMYFCEQTYSQRWKLWICSMDNETVNRILFMCPYARLSGLCLRFMLLQMGKCHIQQINKSVSFGEPETSRSYWKSTWSPGSLAALENVKE